MVHGISHMTSPPLPRFTVRTDKRISNVTDDLKDGVIIMMLIAELSGKKAPKYNKSPKVPAQIRDNWSCVVKYMKSIGIQGMLDLDLNSPHGPLGVAPCTVAIAQWNTATLPPSTHSLSVLFVVWGHAVDADGATEDTESVHLDAGLLADMDRREHLKMFSKLMLYENGM